VARQALPPAGLYQPGTSALHRLPAGAKLLALAVLLSALVIASSTSAVGIGLALTAAGYGLAGVGWRVALAQVWPLRWFAVVLLALQWWLSGAERALVTVGGLVVAVALAGLVTVTTRVTAMTAAFAAAMRPLRVVGVDPDRVALLMALGIRAVPVVAGLAAEVREAHRARGLRLDPRTYGVPLVVRTLRHADTMGEALAARGLDD
jgi:biotin transport system permease protein